MSFADWFSMKTMTMGGLAAGGEGEGLGEEVGDGCGTPPSSAPTLRSRSETRHSKAFSAERPSDEKTKTTATMRSVFDPCFRRCLPLMDLPLVSGFSASG
jgi:hypothetical protein